MRRLLVIVILSPQFTLLVHPARAQDAAKASGPTDAQLERFHLLLDRNPQKGTAFDLLYQKYLDAGRLDDLVARYEQKTQDEPDNAAGHLVLGLIHERRHRYEKSLAALDRAAKLSPDDYRPQAYRAVLLARSYRPDEAISAYEAALAANPPRRELMEIYKQLGRMHARQGQMDEALATWSDLAAAFPGDRFAIEELARLLVEEEQYDEAIKWFEQLVELSSQDLYAQLVARIEIGQVQVRQGKLNTAIETFESCLAQVRPESWIARDIRRRIEQIFERSGDLTGLVEYYRGRLENEPDDLATRVQLAGTLARLGNRDEALAEYRGVLERAPSRRDVREKLVDELIRGGDYADAIAETEALLAQHPSDVEILTQLGHLYLHAGEGDGRERAIETWQRIAEVRPDDPLLAVQAAELCRDAAGIGSRFTPLAGSEQNAQRAESEFGKAALALYQEAVRRSPDAGQYHEFLGEFLYAIGRDDEALAAWREVAAPPRDTAENLRRLAEILASVDRFDDATTVVAQAIAKEPQRHDLHAQAADLFMQKKDYDTALAHVSRMEELADTPFLEEQALEERAAIYGAANRLDEELPRLEAKADAGDASVRDLWLAGMIAATQRRSNAALGFLEKAIELAPEDVRLFRYKADVHKQGGDLAGAAEQYRKLVDLEPRRRTEHLKELIRLELDLGRIDAAKEAAQKLVRFSPGNVESVAVLADVHLRAGEVDEALEAYRRAVLDDPRNIEARLTLAGRLADHQRIDEAVEHYWRAFEQSDELEQRISIAGTLAEQHLITGRIELLLERLEQWRREQEDKFVATLCLVEAHTRAEDYVNARRELAALSAERPEDVQVLGQLAALAEHMGDKQQAAEHLEAIVAKTSSPDPRMLQRLAGLYEDLNEPEKVEEIWGRIADQVQDEKSLLSAIDRSLQSSTFSAAAALCAPQWSTRPDDWRFGVRLALAYWFLGERDAAAEVAQRLVDLPPTDNYADPATTPSSQSGPSARSYGYRPPQMLMRVYRPVQLRQMLAQSASRSPFQRMPMQYMMPDDLVGAQQIAFFMLYEQARADGRHEQLVEELTHRSDANIGALRHLAWVRMSERDADATGPLLERWIEAQPDEAEPRVALMMLPQFSRRQPPTGGVADEAIEAMQEQQAWLMAHRPEVGRYTALVVAQMLMQQNKRDEARAALVEVMDQAQNISEFAQVAQLASQLEDTELVDKLIARIGELTRGRGYAMGPMNVGEILSQSVQMSIQQRDWERSLDLFDRFMEATHPRALGAFGFGNGASTSSRRYYGGGFAVAYGSSRRSGQAGSFPGPSPWLDAGRVQVLTMLHRSLASAGEADRLTELIEDRVSNSEGLEQQCWRMCRVVVHWRENEYERAVELLRELVEEAPGNAAVRMVLAQAHSQLREHDKALAALENTHVPFGPLAKELEQLRMELAQRVGDEESTKDAALRLFGMRLTSDEQSELAQVLTQLGLATRSEELMRRAVRTAGSDPSQLYSLMRQAIGSDPERAAQIARTIIQQTPRSNQPRDGRSQYRLQALQLLARSGELARMIEKAEEQLEAAPNSVKLLEDLAEYYTAAGNQEEALAILERIGEVRPNDPALQYRSAQMLLARGKLEEGLALFDVVWEKDPQLILNDSYEISRYYARAKKLDLLAEQIKKLKGNAQVLQNSYQLVNLVDNLRHSGAGIEVDGVIGLYQAVREVTPREQQEHIVQQLGSFLNEKNRKEDALALYKEVVFPRGDDGGADAGTTVAQTVYFSEGGQMTTSLMRVADLAAELKETDKLQREIEATAAENEDWAPHGRLLAAMLHRRSGREEPLVELGRFWLDDEEFSEELGGDYVALRQELAECRSTEALRAAIEIWQKDRSAQQAADPSTAVQIASLWMKLKEPDKARETLLAAMNVDLPTGVPSQYAVRQSVNQQVSIANALAEHRFYLDALAAFGQALGANFSDLDPNDYTLRRLVPQARQQMAQCVQQILAQQKNAALDALMLELDKETPELSRFFTVADPVTADEMQEAARYGYGAFVNGGPIAAADGSKLPTQLLPALLAAAHEAGRLDRLASATDVRLAAADDDVEDEEKDRLAALRALISLHEGRQEEAAKTLEAWLARMEQQKQLAGRGATWLLTLAALGHEETRPIGRKLAAAVARQAGVQGMIGRQQAAVMALTSHAGGDSSDDLAKLLTERRGDPRLRLQAALAQFQQKDYDAAVSLLEGLWQTDADLLLPQLDQLTTLYLEAGRLGDLAEGLRGVRDGELQANYSSQVAQLFQRLPREEKHLDEMVEFYHAAREFAGDHNVSYLANRWNSYLQGLPRTERTLQAYQRTLFGDPEGAAQLQQVVRSAVDLAASLKKLDDFKAACNKAIEEHATWKLPGEIVLAIVARREGDESPLVETAKKLDTMAALPPQLQEASGLLRDELAQCSGRPAVEMALKLWEPLAAAESGQSTHASTQVAGLFVKLDRRDDARDVLLAALERPFAVPFAAEEEYIIQQKLQMKNQLANALAGHAFQLDALTAYADILATDVSSVQSQSYVHRMVGEAYRSVERLVQQMVTHSADAVLGQLEDELAKADDAPDLSAFFVVLDPPATLDANNRGGSEESIPDSVKLLPSLLAKARETNRLEPLAEAVSAARGRHADQLPLVALDAIIALAVEKPDAATESLRWIDENAANSPTPLETTSVYLAAEAGLSTEATQEVAARLMEDVAAAAAENGNRPRQAAAVTALAESLRKQGKAAEADALLQRMLAGDDADGEALLQLARVHFRSQEHDRAVAALARVWEKEPELAVAKFQELVTIYIAAEKADELAEALRALRDNQLKQQYGHDLINALRNLGYQGEHADDAVTLLEAVADSTTEDRREQAYTSLANVLLRHDRKDEAWDAYRRAVLPPTGQENSLSSQAASFVKLSQELGKLGDVKSATKEAIERHAQWKTFGELLLAMVEQRMGNEDLLVKMAERLQTDPIYAAETRGAATMLRSELARCDAEVALRLAATMWENEFEQMRIRGNVNNDYRQYDELAGVYVKLGEREKARQLWLQAASASPNYYGGDYIVYHLFERREHLAPKLLEAGFALDALRLFEENREAAALPQGEQYQLAQRLDRQQDARRNAILGVLTDELDTALASLHKSLTAFDVPDVGLYFAVADRPWTATEWSRIPEPVRGDSPRDVQILPALVRHAAEQREIDGIREALQKKVAQHPGDEQLAAFAALLAVWQGRNAAASAEALLELSRSEEAGVRALAVAALGEFPGADVTARLLEAARADRAARSRALAALSRQDTPSAAEAIGKLLATPDPALRRQAQEALERMQTPRARELFRWDVVARDEFDGGPSLSWQIVNHDPAYLSYEKSAGMLTLVSHRGSFHAGEATHKNVLTLPVPDASGDLQITTCVVGFTPAVAFQQAALLAWNDDQNYLKLSYEAGGPNRPSLAVIPESGGNVSTRADVPDIKHDGKLWLRLTKLDNRYVYSTSTDGETFQTYGEMPWGDGNVRFVGITAASPGGENVPEVDVAFDFFEVRAAAGEAVLSPDELVVAEVTQQIENGPENAALYFQRAELYARRAKWKEAAADVARGLELDPSDHWNWYRGAALALQQEDRETYERYCKEMLQRFANTDAIHIAERVSKACLFSPEPVEPEQAARLAQRAVRGGSGSNIYQWILLSGGIAKYRSGDDRSAIAALQESVSRAGEGELYCSSAARCFLAMARHRQGEADAAARELAEAKKLIEQFPSGDEGAEIAPWNDWIFSHVALREAKETLGRDSNE